MKELIEETLRENEDRKEQLKKQLDWKSLDVVVDRQKRMEEQKKYLKTFKFQHFQKKKPSKFKIIKPKKENLRNTVYQKDIYSSL